MSPQWCISLNRHRTRLLPPTPAVAEHTHVEHVPQPNSPIGRARGKTISRRSEPAGRYHALVTLERESVLRKSNSATCNHERGVEMWAWFANIGVATAGSMLEKDFNEP